MRLPRLFHVCDEACQKKKRDQENKLQQSEEQEDRLRRLVEARRDRLVRTIEQLRGNNIDGHTGSH